MPNPGDEQFQDFVRDADCVLRVKQRFDEVMPPLIENFFDPDLQDSVAQFLQSDELQQANIAIRNINAAGIEEDR